MRFVKRAGRRKVLVVALLVGVALLNAEAFIQARAMTHYTSGGARTDKPEALSLLQKAGVLFTGVTIPRPQNSSTPGDLGLRYDTRRISLGSSDYLEAWHIAGAAPKAVVLMFPAYAASKDSLLPAAAALNSLGYSTLLVDFRGVGGSSGSDTTLGVREAVDVASSVDYARKEWPGSKLVLYGESMGSAAIMRALAVEGTQADATILESPFDNLLNTVGNRFYSMGLPAFPGAPLVVFWGSLQQGFNGFTHNPADYAPAIRCPTLILYGDQDPRVTAAEVHSVYSRLGGPKSFITFPGAGHESLSLFAPDTWKQQVGQFLAQTGK